MDHGLTRVGGRDPRGLTITPGGTGGDRQEPDLIVLNRGSEDLSVIKTVNDAVFGLEKSTDVFPVDGTLTSMVMGHYNASEDGYLDVMATNPKARQMLVSSGASMSTLTSRGCPLLRPTSWRWESA